MCWDEGGSCLYPTSSTMSHVCHVCHVRCRLQQLGLRRSGMGLPNQVSTPRQHGTPVQEAISRRPRCWASGHLATPGSHLHPALLLCNVIAHPDGPGTRQPHL